MITTTPQPFNSVAPWVCLDIETRGGRPEDAPKWVRENWWPNENLLPATIGQRFKTAIDETEKKMGLLDTAGIATVQLKTPTTALVLHNLTEHEPRGVEKGLQIGFADEARTLLVLREWLDTYTDAATTLVGWNIKGFDLRRLRFAYLRAGLNVPKALRVTAPVYDMMKEFAEHFSVDRNPFVKLEVALEAFGMRNHKKDFEGSMVDTFIRAGKFDEVLKYAWEDIEQEAELFLRMTGQSGALK